MWYLLNIICMTKKFFNIFKLIVKLSFELTFWTQIQIELNCSHFQLNSSQVAHIFNLTWLDSTENWVNSTQFVKNLSLMSRKLNIEIFPIFDFCIIFLHYILIESHEEKHEDCLIKSHDIDEKYKEKHEEKHEDRLIKNHDKEYREKHEEKHEEKTWRLFDFNRELWRKNMVESHEEKSCRLFN